MATINCAEYFGIADDHGSISPGKLANLALFDSLEDLRDPTVYVRGKVVVEQGHYLGDRSGTAEVPELLRAKVNIGHVVTTKDFRIPAPVRAGKVRVRVMGVKDGTLISEALEATVVARDGEILSDPEHDVLKIAVLDRHKATGAIGLGFVKGFGLVEGALATTFFWQHFSLLVVGTSDEEMAAAVAAMKEIGGGVLATQNGKLVHATALPVGGILGAKSLEAMRDDLAEFERAARKIGCRLENPFTNLGFASIPHIPHYGITDRGFYDTYAEKFVDVVLEAE
jgi:adenine deaminase